MLFARQENISIVYTYSQYWSKAQKKIYEELGHCMRKPGVA